MISAIVCTDQNYGIGYKNELLINIKEDLQHFKNLTTNNIVIMGRKTYESLPKRPLPNRTNFVVTHNPIETDEDVVYVTLDEVKTWLSKTAPKTSKNIFVMGGESIYKELLPYCDNVYLTRVYKSFENVDTYFPNLNIDNTWKLSSTSDVKEDNGARYQFCTFDKVRGR